MHAEGSGATPTRPVARPLAREDCTRAPRWRATARIVLFSRGRPVSRFGQKHQKSATCEAGYRSGGAPGRAHPVGNARRAPRRLAGLARRALEVGALSVHSFLSSISPTRRATFGWALFARKPALGRPPQWTVHEFRVHSRWVQHACRTAPGPPHHRALVYSLACSVPLAPLQPLLFPARRTRVLMRMWRLRARVSTARS